MYKTVYIIVSSYLYLWFVKKIYVKYFGKDTHNTLKKYTFTFFELTQNEWKYDLNGSYYIECNYAILKY